MRVSDDFMRLLAAWALVHETADEGWKAAVARGADVSGEDMDSGPDAFVDGLSALVAAEKERLKAEIASGAVEAPGTRESEAERIDGLRFEVAELRGRIETLQASIDALLAREDADGPGPGPAKG